MTKLWERKLEQRLGQQSYIIRECLVYAGRSTIDANFYSDNLRRSLKQRGKYGLYFFGGGLWWGAEVVELEYIPYSCAKLCKTCMKGKYKHGNSAQGNAWELRF